jgi:uncharacterized protein
MKIAVIGSGISGLSASWLLSKHHEVHLFESDSRLGGHAHTVDVQEGTRSVPVDTGFLVYNELTYPHLCGFFKALGVLTTESDMSLSIQSLKKNLEWSGTSLNSVFAQRRNLLRPRFYKMLFDIRRFAKEATANLELSRAKALSLGDLLKARRFTDEFCHDYLIPAGAAIWSTPEEKILDFPAETFLTFFMNHRLLEMHGRPIWRTVVMGSREYVKLAAKSITHIHLETPVLKVERRNSKIFILTKAGQVEFDRVVMATHAPLTRKILANQSDSESKILKAFSTEANRAVLHTDSSSMPERKLCWASWNVLGTHGFEKANQASLTYYINRLQPLSTKTDYFVSLNPDFKPLNILQQFSYAHPQFDRGTIEAQKELDSIQGVGGVYYAGAWTRYGFHEDGILSAVNVAKKMNIVPPWELA